MININWGKSKEDSFVNIQLIDGDNNIRFNVPLKYSNLIHNENFKENFYCRDYVYSRFKNPIDAIKIYFNNKKKIFDLFPFFGFCMFIMLFLYFIFYIIYKIIQIIFYCLYYFGSLIIRIIRKKEEKIE